MRVKQADFSMNQRLSTKKRWDGSWEKFDLPREITRTMKGTRVNSRLDIIDAFFLPNTSYSILEIGGAPGQYLAYMSKNFHYKIHALDYSEIGCKKTKENLRILNLEGEVYNKDLLSDDLTDLPNFDIVYSMGFIEHFLDLNEVIGKHLSVLKPGGIILLGAPNLLGINYWLMKILSPKKLLEHNLISMNIENWHNFEKEFGLQIIFKNYIGGFDPVYKYEEKNLLNQLINILIRGLSVFIFRLSFLKNLNSKYWSGYIMGIYRKPK